MASKSKAWADLERAVAVRLGGRRVLRGSDYSLVAPDVVLDDFPHWQIDSKYRRAQPWKHHSYVLEIRKKYCKDGDVPVLVTKTGNQRGAYVTLSLDDFAGIVNALRGLRKFAGVGDGG